MNVRTIKLTLVASVAAWGGSAHSQARSYDPCRPAPVYLGAIGALANAIGNQQRQSDCAALRQAQWADYNTRKQAAHDRAVEAAAVAEAASRQAQIDAQATQDRMDRDRAVAERKAEAAAAGRRAEEAKAENQRRSQQAEADRARYISLIAAEKSPENLCRKQEMARSVIDGWNGLDNFKDAGIKVIDIEHLTTATYDTSAQVYACHGMFMTNKGWNVLGTLTLKRNVAGDPMIAWLRDADQDVSRYGPPPGFDASSPEIASHPQVKVQAVVAPPSAAVARDAPM